MWRFNATPTRVAAPDGDVPGTGRPTLPSPMSTLKQLQGQVASRMRRGDTFASVEAGLIDPSGLSEAEKAALWLYGWSFVSRRRQRREAIAHIDLLAATPTASGDSVRRLRAV